MCALAHAGRWAVRPRLAFQIATIVIALGAFAAPVAAQGFFDWFSQRQDDRYVRQNPYYGQRQGPGPRQESSGRQQRQYTPQASAYSDQGLTMQERHGPASAPSIGGSTGQSVAYCVRLCDGGYFPMQRHTNATSIQLFSAFCPATKKEGVKRLQMGPPGGRNGGPY